MVDSDTREDINRMIQEDLWAGDVTTDSLIDEGVEAEGVILTTQPGYIVGISEMLILFDELGANIIPKVSDGDEVKEGDLIAKVEGPAKSVLKSERVALNLLSRMSGVATATKEMADKAREVNPDVVIAATRKTTPLLRSFEKRAVKVVGGEPHRYHLGDFVLIKDNHLKLVGSVEDAVRKAKEAGLSDRIEVEVTDMEGALSGAKAGADIVMLDNFDPEGAKRAVEALEKAGLREKLLLEASGGIDPSNVEDYAGTGVDIISSSYMTMSAPALDIKLEITGKNS